MSLPGVAWFRGLSVHLQVTIGVAAGVALLGTSSLVGVARGRHSAGGQGDLSPVDPAWVRHWEELMRRPVR